MFNIIFACDLHNGIGKNNELPWFFKKDLNYFKNITIGKLEKSVVIMGRNTMKSLPLGYLKDRYNIVISSSQTNNPNIIIMPNLNKALEKAYEYCNDHNNIWVIGGQQLYEEAIRHKDLNLIYQTHINGEFNCDKFFKIDNKKLNIVQNKLNETFNDISYDLIFMRYNIERTAEQKYLNLLENVMKEGSERKTRNGITYSLFDKNISFDVSNTFPLLTTKKMFLRGIIEELLFFIRGETNTKLLEEKNVKIWVGNTNKDFLNKMNFNYDEGEMGPMYGYQWRNFNKPYKNDNEKGIDQLKNLIEEIKDNPNSRRLLMTDFNPAQVKEGVLYPCHSLILQFYVNDKDLSVKMYQRSADLFLGLPFNISSTTLLLYIISKITGLNPKTVSISLGDCHIYEEHKNQVIEQLSRTPYNEPTLSIPNFKSIEEVENSVAKDFVINNYKSYPSIKANMIA